MNFPIHAPTIASIEVTKRAKVRGGALGERCRVLGPEVAGRRGSPWHGPAACAL